MSFERGLVLTISDYRETGHLVGLLGLVLMSALFFVPNARAAAITMSAFSGNETVETFDPNFGRSNSPVTFNGVTYTSESGSELWSDIDWTSNGHFATIPGASQGFALNDLVSTTNLNIDFSTPVNRVGVLLGTGLVTSWTLTAFDDNLQPLGSVVVTMPGTPNALTGVFGGLEFTSNIRRLNILEVVSNNNQITILDDLRYEATPVPEPVSITLLGLGLGCLAILRYHRRARA